MDERSDLTIGPSPFPFLRRLVLGWLALLPMSLCGDEPLPARSYAVGRLVSDRILIDGVLDEQAWNEALADDGFSLPWEDVEPPSTVFRAIRDEEHLYFSFQADDATPVVAEDFPSEMIVAREDRVELFFASDRSLARYFCVEIDPLGRMLDYEARFHRQFDQSWSFPPGIVTAATRSATSYTVEGRIPWSVLEGLGLPSLRKGEAMTVGIFRADFRKDTNGAVEEHWISWGKPQVAAPDFHVPSAFGELR